MKKIKFANMIIYFGTIIGVFGYLMPRFLTDWLPMLMDYIYKIPDKLILLQWVCRIIFSIGVSCVVAYLILWSILIIIGFIGLLLGFDNKKQK